MLSSISEVHMMITSRQPSEIARDCLDKCTRQRFCNGFKTSNGRCEIMRNLKSASISACSISKKVVHTCEGLDNLKMPRLEGAEHNKLSCKRYAF